MRSLHFAEPMFLASTTNPLRYSSLQNLTEVHGIFRHSQSLVFASSCISNYRHRRGVGEHAPQCVCGPCRCARLLRDGAHRRNVSACLYGSIVCETDRDDDQHNRREQRLPPPLPRRVHPPAVQPNMCVHLHITPPPLSCPRDSNEILTL